MSQNFRIATKEEEQRNQEFLKRMAKPKSFDYFEIIFCVIWVIGWILISMKGTIPWIVPTIALLIGISGLITFFCPYSAMKKGIKRSEYIETMAPKFGFSDGISEKNKYLLFDTFELFLQKVSQSSQGVFSEIYSKEDNGRTTLLCTFSYGRCDLYYSSNIIFNIPQLKIPHIYIRSKGFLQDSFCWQGFQQVNLASPFKWDVYSKYPLRVLPFCSDNSLQYINNNFPKKLHLEAYDGNILFFIHNNLEKPDGTLLFYYLANSMCFIDQCWLNKTEI